jgi:anaerobic ribonucleoside-triphosphate reductase activating protein
LKFRIANLTSSTIDGIGISLVVFFQGCFHNCIGCQNPSLQDPNNGYDYDTKDIISELQSNADFYDSIVLTGGDPLAQPKPLYTLLVNTTLPVILYTGYLFEDIPKDVTSLCSIVVEGPFKQELQIAGFPASSNQRVFFNTGRLSDQQIKDFITPHNMTLEPNFYENSANF